ncbi:hypothetical protein D9Q98_008392 [Chlorella vulgaris]|uniref:Mut7-C RNAse domain-containing protein n=1 Tax=Chlorella vulgaris TaxID=3077 RepID=A0A9D4TGM3_CHLVU|nr:hypothetical protein D9Q98_008392 [Chlorella vulgaris]
MAGHWVVPDDVPLVYVDTAELLQELSPVLEAALCCAIDAEWPPEEAAAERRSGGLPHASLLQLALALPASCTLPSAVETACCGRGTPVLSGGCCVLLLDMMLLPPSAVKPALQQLFRARSCLKLGFGLVHDLRATAAALGSEGGSCIAVVEPACDLGTVHRFLRHQAAPGVPKVVDHGLSALCAAQLGLPLDKQLQCSAWGERPLSKDQLCYAAADAACLLALLASFVAAVGSPQGWPLAHDDDAAAASSGSSGQQQQSVRSSSPAAPAPAEEEGEEAEATEQGLVLAAAAANNAQAGASPPASQSSQTQQPAAEEVLPELLAGCSLQQLRAAAAAWGNRLEINGTGAAKRCGKRGGNARRQQRQGAAGGGGGRLPAGCSGFPLHVPWLEAAGGEGPAAARFLVDTMADGLAKQLRLCGFDAESLQATLEKAPRHTIYRVMVERAEEEGRVILTRDRTFIAASYSEQAYLVTADTKRQQLEQVLSAFNLQLDQRSLLSRCARCNGEFQAQPRPAALLPLGHDVPAGIQAQHEEFWVCSRCSGVFWQGNQYSRAIGQMTEMISRLSLQAVPGGS